MIGTQFNIFANLILLPIKTTPGVKPKQQKLYYQGLGNMEEDTAHISKYETILFDEKSDVQAVLDSLAYFENLYTNSVLQPDFCTLTSNLMHKVLSLLQKVYARYQAEKENSDFNISFSSISFITSIAICDCLPIESNLFIESVTFQPCLN